MPSFKRSRSNQQTPNQLSFNLPPTKYPPGTPYNSKRSKKLFSELFDEREFLLYLRKLWKAKLNTLQEDHKLLTQMKNQQAKHVKDLEPLFSRDEEEELEEEGVRTIQPSFDIPSRPTITVLESSTDTQPIESDDEEEKTRQAMKKMLEEFNMFL